MVDPLIPFAVSFMGRCERFINQWPYQPALTYQPSSFLHKPMISKAEFSSYCAKPSPLNDLPLMTPSLTSPAVASQLPSPPLHQRLSSCRSTCARARSSFRTQPVAPACAAACSGAWQRRSSASTEAPEAKRHSKAWRRRCHGSYRS